jgi:hypothetical protein
MDNQHQPGDLASRPSFSGKIFAQPPAWRLIPQAGSRFWAGVLAGVGLGLMVAVILVDQEILTAHSKSWTMLPAMILFLVGQERLRVVVRREGKGN